MGEGGGERDKESRTPAVSFCLPHLRWEALSGFLLQRQGMRWDPLGPAQFASPERAVFGSERRILLAGELNTGALLMFSISYFIKEEEGCDCIPGKDYYSWRATQREVVKIPSKIPGSEEMLCSLMVLLAFFCKSPILTNANPQIAGTCC